MQGRAFPWPAVLMVMAAFAALNLAAVFSLPPDAAMKHGGESTSWSRPAQGLLKHGGFVDPDNPARPETHRGPGYPSLLAVTMILANKSFPRLAVGLQLVLLLLTGLVAMRFVDRLLPGYGVAALVFVAFNPNALGTAYLIQAETLYGFMIALVIWATLAYAEAPGLRSALAAGGALGAATLVRPEGQFLVVLLPMALLILPSIEGPKLTWRRRFAAAGLCFALAAALMVPWMARNQSVGAGFGLSSVGTMSYYLWGSAAQVEMAQARVAEPEAERRMAAKRAALIAKLGERWRRLSKTERNRVLARGAIDTLLSFSPRALLEVVAKATLQFFTAGGAGDIQNLYGMGNVNTFEVYIREKHTDYFAAWLSAVGQSGWAALGISAIALGYVLVFRLLGLAGVATMMRRRQWRVLFVAGAAIGYFALIIPFYGNSRFRLPVESLLVLLALYGVDGLRRRKANAGR